jgi:hypothetical protein
MNEEEIVASEAPWLPHYRWICTDCHAANAEQTTHCAACGCPAVVSAVDLEHRRGDAGVPVPATQKVRIAPGREWLALVSFPAVFIGVLLERFTIHPMTAWWVGIALLIAGGLGMWASLASTDERADIPPPDEGRD